MRLYHWRRIFTVTLLFAVALSAFGADLSRELAERVQSAVVRIEFEDGYGSGFFLGADGLIITAAHTIYSITEAEVHFSDGRKGMADFISFSPSGMDLAALQLRDDLPEAYLNLGSPEDIHPGKTVFAVGNPHPIYPSLISRGTIGFHHREHLTIVHDASISNGSSGGPLVLDNGEVVGVLIEMLHSINNRGTEILSGYNIAVELRAIEELLTAIQSRQWETIKTAHLSYLKMPLPLLRGDTVVESSLHSQSDRLPGDLSYAEGYHIDLEAGKTFEILLESEDFDAYLLLYDDVVELVDENDDAHSETTDALLLFPPERTARYTIVVTSFGPGETGDYRLSVTEWITETLFSEVYQLDATLPMTEAGQYYLTFPIEGEVGDAYIVSMQSDEIDSFLELYDSAGNLVAENDDWNPGSGLDAKILFKLSEDQPFSVLARSFGEGEMGSFTLVIERRLE